jgi:trimeric autotransporter adhesin
MGGKEMQNLARIHAYDGTIDESWHGPEFLQESGNRATVQAMKTAGNWLWVAGNFASADGLDRNNVAAIDKHTGQLLEAWNDAGEWTTDGGPVYATSMVHHGGVLYVGGRFEEVGGNPRTAIAAFDATDGSLIDDWNLHIGAGSVRSMTVHNGLLFVGGIFSEAGPDADENNLETVNALVAYDLSANEIDWDWDGGLSSSSQTHVASLMVDDGLLYVGGNFELAGKGDDDTGYSERESMAAFNRDTAELDTGWSPEFTSTVRHMAIDQGLMYVAGSFQAVDTGNGSVDRAQLALLDTNNANLIEEWNPGMYGFGYGRQLIIHEGRAFLIGRNEWARSGSEPDGRYTRRSALMVMDTEFGDFIW